jgi:ribosome assembly protein 4
MATVVPPPSKKAKLEARRSANAGATIPSGPAVNLVVQFTSSKDGTPIGPPIRLPADTDRAGLELLANKLAKAQNQDDDDEEQDDEPTPYSFHVSIPAPSVKGKEKAPQEFTRVPVLKDLQEVLKKNESSISVEDVLTVVCEPEAIFKVRQVTRCSSTLAGEAGFP